MKLHFYNEMLEIRYKKNKNLNFVLDSYIKDSNPKPTVSGLAKIENGYMLKLLNNMDKKERLFLQNQLVNLPFCIQNDIILEFECAGGPGSKHCECSKSNDNQNWKIKIHCSNGFYSCCETNGFDPN